VPGSGSHLPLLYGDLTAAENLIFYGRMFAVPSLTERVNQVLTLVGLSNRSEDLVRTFSRGMQQRLAIGRAVLHDPEVLLLDEPHTGLDQDACDMLDEVLREVAVLGRTVLMTSHDFVRVQNLANRFDVLSRGKIVSTIKSDQLSQDGLQAFYRQALEQK
jgi:heme exporter protein A